MFRAVRFVCAASLIVISLCLATGRAAAEKVLYSAGFETKAREWSSSETIPFGQGLALGPFNSRHKEAPHRLKLELPDLPAVAGLVLEFDLILLGKWESEGTQADRFEVLADGNPLLTLTQFPCDLTDEAENLPAGTPGAVPVFNRFLGSCVLKQRLALPADRPLELKFVGTCTGRRSEFWAIDNVRVIQP